MVIDPRTLREIEAFANCHLIPQAFGISNKTVPLDEAFDNIIGSRYDSELQALLREFEAEGVRGKAKLAGSSFSAECNPKSRFVTFYKGKRSSKWPVNVGESVMVSFRGRPARIPTAYVSILN